MPKIDNVRVYNLDEAIKTAKYPKATDLSKLNSDLTPGIKACLTCGTGEGHDNALKGVIVCFDLTFSNKAWVEAQRYHFLEFVSSQSSMHKITKFNIKKQCNKYVDTRIIDVLQEKIDEYNRLCALPNLDSLSATVEREKLKKEAYLDILYNIPSGFELTAGMVTNYQQLKTIYLQRRHHRLPDWKCFCDFCESLPRFMELTQKEKNNA